MRNKDEELRREGMAYALQLQRRMELTLWKKSAAFAAQQNYHLRYPRMQ